MTGSENESRDSTEFGEHVWHRLRLISYSVNEIEIESPSSNAGICDFPFITGASDLNDNEPERNREFSFKVMAERCNRVLLSAKGRFDGAHVTN